MASIGCFIASDHHLKHSLQSRIPTLAHCPLSHLFQRDQQRPWIRKLQPIRESINHDPALTAIVGMNQCFHQRFLNRSYVGDIPLLIGSENIAGLAVAIAFNSWLVRACQLAADLYDFERLPC
jgi:hypothetical protein